MWCQLLEWSLLRRVIEEWDFHNQCRDVLLFIPSNGALPGSGTESASAGDVMIGEVVVESKKQFPSAWISTM